MAQVVIAGGQTVGEGGKGWQGGTGANKREQDDGERLEGCKGTRAQVQRFFCARVHGYMGAWVHGYMGAWVHGCMLNGAQGYNVTTVPQCRSAGARHAANGRREFQQQWPLRWRRAVRHSNERPTVRSMHAHAHVRAHVYAHVRPYKQARWHHQA